jgi:hypothetical protein
MFLTELTAQGEDLLSDIVALSDSRNRCVVNPKAETREKRHNGAERCLSHRSRINKGRKWVVLSNSTRTSVKRHWNG